ncbi:probable cytochrome P450 49a1 [Neocloeon triangulifer]|uniref:probable cytochrome P450 49a1 n=1 Tax=Neocloeon triangulifer TaxID=2078957 RepID=UPI00286F319B|nr:probable cytochrome P450 49a1 [Neocloeon triangulifer]
MVARYLLTNFAARGSVLLSKRGRANVAAVFPNASASAVRPYDEIPGPKPLPLIGNAWRFLPYIGSFDISDFAKWSSSLLADYGKIVKISNIPGRKDMVLIYDPDMIAEVYKNEGQWPTRFVIESVKYFRDKVRPDFFEGYQGLVNENGEKWQQARTVANQPMMRIEVANLYVPKSDEVSKDFVKLAKQLRGSNMEMPEDFKNEINKWALESISLIALDTRLGCLQLNLAKDSEAQQMIDAVINVFNLSFELDFKLPIWKLIATKELKEFIKYEEDILRISSKYVEQAMQKIGDLNAPETPDSSFLHRILKREPSKKRAVILGMDTILAGVDTTANSAAMVLYYLAKNPKAQEKLYQEVKSVVPTNPNESITSSHLNKMKYMRACLKEAMRLAPVTTGNVRRLDKDIVLDNYLIPKNKADLFMFNSTLYSQDEYYPRAKEFIPERWLREDISECPVNKKAHQVHPYVYKPFGHGVRQCPGMRFANMEIETLIARMLLSFKLEWHQPDVKLVSKALQGPISPLKYTLIDRK